MPFFLEVRMEILTVIFPTKLLSLVLGVMASIWIFPYSNTMMWLIKISTAAGAKEHKLQKNFINFSFFWSCRVFSNFDFPIDKGPNYANLIVDGKSKKVFFFESKDLIKSSNRPTEMVCRIF